MERAKIKIFPNETNELAEEVANIIISEINMNNAANRPTVLGLATGNTPLDVYRELIRQYREGKVDFSRVISFNLDEYFELPPDHENSYNRFMFDNLFSHINIKRENIHIPQGLTSLKDIKEYCDSYEASIKNAGGIDIQLLGIGRDGHIGFNEPLSPEDSRTRLVELDKVTLNDAVREFGDVKLVPTRAITMGVQTIMDSKRVILIATGDHKAKIIRQAVEMPPNPEVVASYLQKHTNATFYLDQASASELTRISKPWIFGPVDWSNPRLQSRAVCYLSETTKKSIAELEVGDFVVNMMEGLIKEVPLATLKTKVLNEMVGKITSNDRLPVKKSVLILAPHTEDDVVAMGGTIQKLIANLNHLACVYMTPGTGAVLDYEAQKFAMAKLIYSQHVGDKSLIQKDQDLVTAITQHINKKKASRFGMPDTVELTTIKAVVREAEAAACCNYFGVPQCEFMNGATVEKVRMVIEKHKPNVIFACGDLTDPNSAHRLCLRVILSAYRSLPATNLPELWLYRVDSNEFHPAESDMLVPLSATEMEAKIIGTVYHQSQNYKLQLGTKQLWQKVEERSQHLSNTLKQYGVTGYTSYESFKKHTPIIPGTTAV